MKRYVGFFVKVTFDANFSQQGSYTVYKIYSHSTLIILCFCTGLKSYYFIDLCHEIFVFIVDNSQHQQVVKHYDQHTYTL